MLFVFFKQKTAYEMRISDWSSDVCSSDLDDRPPAARALRLRAKLGQQIVDRADAVSADIGRPQLLIGRDVPDHCAREPAARLDDDRIARIDGVQIGRAHV